MMKLLKRMSKVVGVLMLTLMVGVLGSLILPTNHTVAQAAAKLNTKSITMTKGKTSKIKVTGTKSKVKYKTSNKKIATVSSKGVVKAVAKGKTTIKVTVGKKTYKVSVKVEKPSISKTSVSLKKGNTYKLKVNGTSRKIKWSTNNKSVATVSSAGKITAKGKGQAIITAKLNDKKYTCKVTVGGQNVIKCPDSVTLRYGETKKVTLTAGDGFTYGPENYNIVSASISPSYFHVGEKLTMTLTGNAVGTTYIVFKSDEGWTKKCKVTVTGTSVSAGTVSSMFSSVKVNSVRAYRSCNTSKPELYIESSFTNNMNANIDYMKVYYAFYDKNGKQLARGDEFINSPVKGKTYSQKFKVSNSSTLNVNNVASIKVTSIVGRVASTSYGKTNPNINPVITSNSGNTGITVSNITAKFNYGNYYNKVESHFTYTLTNKSSESKSVKIYYDVYDSNGKLIPQEYQACEYKYVHAGETVQVTPGTYGKTLDGALTTGTFSKVVLRVVED